jgi:hypothetical protein
MLAVRPGDSPEIIELCYKMRRAQTKLEKMARRVRRYLTRKRVIEEERKVLRALQAERGDEVAKIRRAELYREVLALRRQTRMLRFQMGKAQDTIFDLANRRSRLRVGQPLNPPRRPKGAPPPPPGPDPKPKVALGFEGPVVVIRRRR